MSDGAPASWVPPDPADVVVDTGERDHTRQLPAQPAPDAAPVDVPSYRRRRPRSFVLAEAAVLLLLLLIGAVFIDWAISSEDRTSRPEVADVPVVSVAPATGSTIVLTDDPYVAARRTAESFFALVTTEQWDAASLETAGATGADDLRDWYDTDRNLLALPIEVDLVGRSRYDVRVVLVQTDAKEESDLPTVLCGRVVVDPTREQVQAFEPVVLRDSSLQVAAPLDRAQQLCRQAHLA